MQIYNSFIFCQPRASHFDKLCTLTQCSKHHRTVAIWRFLNIQIPYYWSYRVSGCWL